MKGTYNFTRYEFKIFNNNLFETKPQLSNIYIYIIIYINRIRKSYIRFFHIYTIFFITHKNTISKKIDLLTILTNKKISQLTVI